MLLFAVVVTVTVAKPENIYASWWEIVDGGQYIVVYNEVTTQTDKVRVYVEKDTTLKISNGTETLFEKTYQEAGKKTAKIPLQKANTTLRFTITDKEGHTGFVERKVKDAGVVSTKKESTSLKKPVVAGKITDKSTSVKVYAKKGATLYVQNGAKVLNKVKYKKDGYQTIPIKKQKAETKITFYIANKTKRSAYVIKEVQDVTAPAKPKVSFAFEDVWDWIDVDGEDGCDVYVRQNRGQKTGKWKYVGTLSGAKSTMYLSDANIGTCKKGDTFSFRLVDDAGNKSKIATTEPVKEDCPSYY